jgi:hypothetical protein
LTPSAFRIAARAVALRAQLLLHCLLDGVGRVDRFQLDAVDPDALFPRRVVEHDSQLAIEARPEDLCPRTGKRR